MYDVMIRETGTDESMEECQITQTVNDLTEYEFITKDDYQKTEGQVAVQILAQESVCTLS